MKRFIKRMLFNLLKENLTVRLEIVRVTLGDSMVIAYDGIRTTVEFDGKVITSDSIPVP
jgi:predicted alpha/beta-fold hydrolase